MKLCAGRVTLFGVGTSHIVVIERIVRVGGDRLFGDGAAVFQVSAHAQRHYKLIGGDAAGREIAGVAGHCIQRSFVVRRCQAGRLLEKD
jgi:hypothetical protein